MKKNFLILMILFIVLPSKVFGYEFTCDKSFYTIEDNINCIIKNNTSDDFDIITGTVTVPKDLTCEISNASDDIDSKIDGLKFTLKKKNISEDLINVACKVNSGIDVNKKISIYVDNFNVNLSKNIESYVVRTDAFTIGKVPPTTTKAKPKDVSDSSSLLKNISDENIDFIFSRFVTDYNISVLYEVEQLNLNIETLYEGATYRIEGNQKLSLGDNVIDIYVTNAEGTKTTCYTLNVKRLVRGEGIYYEDKDATLSDLSVNDHPFTFDYDISDYKINVDYEITDVEVYPVTKVQGATYVITGSNNLKNGSVITIMVTSRDKSTTKKYTITVKKGKEKINWMTYMMFGAIVIVVLFLVGLIVKFSNRNNDEFDKQLIKKKVDIQGTGNQVIESADAKNITEQSSSIDTTK